MTTTYQDIRNKTIKWCEKLLDNGIYEQAKYNECVRGFVDMEVGMLPPEMKPPTTNNEHSYSLYDRQSNYTTRNIARSDSGNILLKTINGMYLACNINGELYLTNGKDLSNQKELEWKLNFQKNNTYTILSTYGNFVGVSKDKRVNASTNIQKATQGTNRKPIANRESLDPSTIWKISKSNNTIIIESVKYPGEKITAYTPITLTKGQTEAHSWLLTDLPSKSESIIPIYEPQDVYEIKNKLLTELENLLKDKFYTLVEIKLLFSIARRLEDKYCYTIKKMKGNIDKLNASFKEKINKELPRTQIPNSGGIYGVILNRKFNNKEFQRYINDFYIPARNNTGEPITKLDYRDYSIFNIDIDTVRPNFPIQTISNICQTQIGRTYPAIGLVLAEKQGHAGKLNIQLEVTIDKFRKLDMQVENKLKEIDEFEIDLTRTIQNDKNKIVNNNIIIERKGNKLNDLESDNRLLATKSNNFDKVQGLSEVNSTKINNTLASNTYKLYLVFVLMMLVLGMGMYVITGLFE